MKEELLILCMGPITQIFVVYLFLFFIQDVDIKSLIFQYNLSILLFNLLPIYPLDGGRILNLLFNQKFAFLKSLNLSLISSSILLLVLVVISIKYNLLINFISILCFLGTLVYKEYKNRKYYFNKFKLERILKQYHFPHIKQIKKEEEMMRDKKHIFLYKGHYITEKEYLKK